MFCLTDDHLFSVGGPGASSNYYCVFPGSKLPAVYQCRNKSKSWVPHMAVLHRPALGTAVPCGRHLLQVLQGSFRLEVPRESTDLLEPDLLCLWAPRPIASHIRVIQRSILWVVLFVVWMVKMITYLKDLWKHSLMSSLNSTRVQSNHEFMIVTHRKS